MLKFSIDGCEYEVKFTYWHTNDVNGNIVKENIPTDTSCFIYRNKTLISSGIAICNYPKEMPVKKIGRKIALTRALSPFTKGFRTTVWKEYFKLTNK